MKKSSILSLSLLFAPLFSLECPPANSSFEPILSEDINAYRSRHVHIFYEPHFKDIAELIKCQVNSTVKEVHLEELTVGLSMERICSLDKYSEKLKDNVKKYKMCMTTITRQNKFERPSRCDAMSQFNLMKTPKNEWAVQVRGAIVDLMLPMDTDNGNITPESLSFALNALFFATAYGVGGTEFKSLTDEEGDMKEKLLAVTSIVYMIAILTAVVAVVILLVLLFAKKRARVQKRESDKSKLLKNPANNNCDDSPVDIVYNDSSENK